MQAVLEEWWLVGESEARREVALVEWGRGQHSSSRFLILVILVVCRTKALGLI